MIQSHLDPQPHLLVTELVDESEAEKRRLQEIRRQLIAGCRGSRHLVPRSTSKCPCRWWPERVINPETNHPFSGPGVAWEFVAKVLEEGCEIEVIILRTPPGGKKGYVIKVPGGLDEHGVERLRIYIKLMFGNGSMVWGRSFHYSSPNLEDDND